MVSMRMPLPLPIWVSSSATWMASSRVGARATAWTAAMAESTFSIIGMPKAAVLPVPGQLLGVLEGGLAGGSQGPGLGGGDGGALLLDHRYAEGGRLARPGSGLPDQVLAGLRAWERLELDVGRALVAHGVQAGQG